MMQTFYGGVADLIVAIHVGCVGYVIVGQVVIWFGWAAGRQSIRNFWFRTTHLTILGVVVFEELFDIRCPLTVWEEHFRGLAGQPVAGESFLGRLLHWLLFYDAPAIVFRIGYLGTAALAFGTFVLCPPRWPFRNRRQSPGPPREVHHA